MNFNVLSIPDRQIYLYPLNFWLFTWNMSDCRTDKLSAHAHRHERHDKFVASKMNRIHCFCVKFLSSPVFPGLGFGTVLLYFRFGCQGFTEPNLFTLLNKNQTPCKRKEYLICGGKGKKDFWKYKKIGYFPYFCRTKHISNAKHSFHL
jgi:hypothetical protein